MVINFLKLIFDFFLIFIFISKAVASVSKTVPLMTILTSEVNPVAPNHFGQRYFGTD